MDYCDSEWSTGNNGANRRDGAIQEAKGIEFGGAWGKLSSTALSGAAVHRAHLARDGVASCGGGADGGCDKGHTYQVI